MIPKFRAFLKDTKKIAEVDSIFFESEVAKVTNNEFYQFEDIILMQSTGLKDKNGVDIFEGDILKNSLGLIGYVTFLIQEAGYVVVLPKRDYRLGHRNTGESYRYAGHHEVIGNICEHE